MNMHLLRRVVTPAQKVIIRSIEQSIYRCIHGLSKEDSVFNYSIINEDGYDVFFGYYDITPFNSKDEILYLKKKKSDDKVLICLNDSNDLSQESVLSFTKAWNWQQGCRLRWFPGSDSKIIFNYYENKHYGARVIDKKGNRIRDYRQPLYDISQDGNIGLTLSFERLGAMRPGYGYTCRVYTPLDLPNESIGIIDMSTDNIVEKLTYASIAEALSCEQIFENCYINHLSFSPKGKFFSFFWIEIINGYHKASLAVCDTNSLAIHPLELDEKVSHYTWIDDDNILCTSYKNSSTCRYFIYNVSKKTKTPFCPQALLEDGHPSIDRGSVILTDTYPDRNGFQRLFLVDSQNESLKLIFTVYMKPTLTGETRTDLHPRFNTDHSKICIDTNRNGHRELIIVHRCLYE